MRRVEVHINGRCVHKEPVEQNTDAFEVGRYLFDVYNIGLLQATCVDAFVSVVIASKGNLQITPILSAVKGSDKLEFGELLERGIPRAIAI